MAFGFGVRPPVLAQRLESLELIVIELGQIARGTVVQELEDLVAGCSHVGTTP